MSQIWGIPTTSFLPNVASEYYIPTERKITQKGKKYIGKKDVKNIFDNSKQLGAVISQVMPNGPEKLKIEDVENVGDLENFMIVFEIQNK